MNNISICNNMSHNNFPFVSSDYKLILERFVNETSTCAQRRKLRQTRSSSREGKLHCWLQHATSTGAQKETGGRAAPPEKENCIVGSNTTLLLEVCQHQYGWGHHTTPHHTWVRQRSSPNLPPRNTRRTVSPQGGNSGWNLGGTFKQLTYMT